jgi:hypothetical protein
VLHNVASRARSLSFAQRRPDGHGSRKLAPVDPKLRTKKRAREVTAADVDGVIADENEGLSGDVEEDALVSHRRRLSVLERERAQEKTYRLGLPLPSVKDDMTVAIIFTLYLLYPTLTSTSFDLFRCTQVLDEQFLTLDLEVQCWKGKHLAWTVAAGVPQVFLFALGLPIFATLTVYHYKKRGLLEDHFTHLKIGSLYDGFRTKDRWYWELALALRKFAIAAVTLITSPVLQAMAALMVLVLSMVANETARPFDEGRQHYRWAVLRWLDLGSLLSGTALMWVGVLISSEQAHGNTGHGISVGVEIVCWIVLLSNISLLIYGIWKYGYERYREKRHLIKEDWEIVKNSDFNNEDPPSKVAAAETPQTVTIELPTIQAGPFDDGYDQKRNSVIKKTEYFVEF